MPVRRKPKKRKLRYSRRKRKVCKKVCTVCRNPYPAGRLTAAKYVRHVRQWHTAQVYCK